MNCSWALWITVSFDVVVMSVGHLNPSPANVLVVYSSSVGNDAMLLESFLKSFWIGLPSIFFISSSYDVRWGL